MNWVKIKAVPHRYDTKQGQGHKGGGVDRPPLTRKRK